MNAKLPLAILIVCVAAVVFLETAPGGSISVVQPPPNGPQMKFVVVDQYGFPVADALVDMAKTDWEDKLGVHNDITCSTDRNGVCQTGPLWYGTYLVQIYKENGGYLPNQQFMKINMSGTLNVILPDEWKRHEGWQRN